MGSIFVSYVLNLQAKPRETHHSAARSWLSGVRMLGVGGRSPHFSLWGTEDCMTNLTLTLIEQSPFLAMEYRGLNDELIQVILVDRADPLPTQCLG